MTFYISSCASPVWRRAPFKEYRQEALNMAHREVSSKPWLLNFLFEWATDFLNTTKDLTDSQHTDLQRPSSHTGLSLESANPQSRASSC